MRFITTTFVAAALVSGLAHGQTPEDGTAGPRLREPAPVTQDPGSWRAKGGGRITQDDITSGAMTLREIRFAGMEVFSTPFTKADGFGDGPMVPGDPTSPGKSLQHPAEELPALVRERGDRRPEDVLPGPFPKTAQGLEALFEVEDPGVSSRS